MKKVLAMLDALRKILVGWRTWQYAVVSVSGLAGMLVFDGWLHMIMLAMAAWPVVVGVYAWRTAGVKGVDAIDRKQCWRKRGLEDT